VQTPPGRPDASLTGPGNPGLGDPRAGPDVMLKATSANGLAAFLAQELSPDELERALGELPPGEALLFQGSLIASARVPFAALNRLTTLAARQKMEPVKEFGRRAGRFIADYGTKTVYKYVLVLMTPEAVLRTASAAWGRIFDRGKLTVEFGDASARIRLEDFPADTAGCARITGFFEFVGSRSAKALKVVHSTCAAERGAGCVWDLTWSR